MGFARIRSQISKKNGNINRRDALENSTEESDRQKAKGVDLSRYDDNWYRFLIHKLITNCTDSRSLLSNEVRFVTFNYDVSLEYNLYKALSAISLFEQNDILTFLQEPGRFIHIYGKIRPDPFVGPPIIKFPSFLTPRPRPNPLQHEEIQIFQEYKSALDVIYLASTELRTIAPNEKTATDDVRAAITFIANAACVYILGYGFDENNSALLELPMNLRLKPGNNKVIMFTNFRNITLVNKNASRVFFGRNDKLLSPNPIIDGVIAGDFLLERSTRDVYGAFNLDFDSPEEQLTTPRQ